MLVRAPLHSTKLALFALFALACAKGPPSGGPGTYRGLATGANEIGVFEVTVTDAAKGPLPATGTLKFPSKSVELTGTLDQSKTQLSLASSDGYKLVGESRPTYAYGSFTDAAGADVGSFGLLLETSSSPVELFCGSGTFEITADAATTEVILPLGILALPGSSAFCVGTKFVLSGDLGTDNAINCASPSGGLIEGNVNGKANPWLAGGPSGTWTVTPCASNGAGGDAGVSGDASAPEGTADAN